MKYRFKFHARPRPHTVVYLQAIARLRSHNLRAVALLEGVA